MLSKGCRTHQGCSHQSCSIGVAAQLFATVISVHALILQALCHWETQSLWHLPFRGQQCPPWSPSVSAEALVLACSSCEPRGKLVAQSCHVAGGTFCRGGLLA